MSAGSSQTPPGGGWLRVALIVGAGAFVAAALYLGHALALEQATLLAEARATGALARHPDLAAAIVREVDPERSRLVLAQALLGDELDQRWRSDLAPAERAREATAGLARLDRAAALARLVLTRHPSSWRAAMILGGARYLRQARERDARPEADRGAWEAPLRAAAALAPGVPEPPRLLALARLDGWYAQSDAERAETRQLVALGLRDPQTFELLLRPWLRSAADPAEALAALPPEPAALAAARDAYGADGQLAGYMAAEHARLELLPRVLAERLAQAETAVETGRGRREDFLAIAGEAPVDARFAPTVARAIAAAPPGGTSDSARRALLRWLRWAIEDWQRGGATFPAAAIGRLAAAAELAPAEDALAAIAAGDLPEAERLERLASGANADDWAPYLIAKAAVLAEREPDVAWHALERVHASARDARYFEVAAKVAAARHDAGAEATAAAGLQALAASAWPATAWRYRDGVAVQDLVLGRGGRGFVLDWAQAPTRDACVEARLDGNSLGLTLVERGAPLAIPRPVSPGLHRLELVQRAGDHALPGALRLLD